MHISNSVRTIVLSIKAQLKRNEMGLVKMLSASESIYSNPVKRVLDIKPILIAIDSTGDEYVFESNVNDKIMWINRPGRTANEKYFIRARVWTKNFKFKRVDVDYVLKPLNIPH